MQKKQDFLHRIILTLAWLVSIFSLPAGATDFFLRPTNISMIDDWTPQLSFFVSNPSDRTIVLKVETRHTRTVLASTQPDEIALKALPAEIVLKAGERKIIRLDYTPGSYQSSLHYEVLVEQLPIIYLKPGDDNMPETMLVTRYVAEVEVRRRKSRQQYAMTAFDRNLETEMVKRAEAQY